MPENTTGGAPNAAQLARELEELRQTLANARADEPALREEISRLRSDISDLADRLRRRQGDREET